MPKTAALSQRSKEIATGLVVLGLVFGGLGVAEIATRLVSAAKFGTAGAVEKAANYAIDATTGLRLPVPGSHHGKDPVSSLGFRSPEIAVPKPPGTVRFAFLGTSTTFDLNNGGGIADSWPHRTIEELRAALPGCELDYVNAGVAGLPLAKIALYLDLGVRPLDPDVVVVMGDDFDAAASDLAGAQGMPVNVEAEWGWLPRHSEFFAKLQKNADVIRLQRRAFETEGKLRVDAPALARESMKALDAIIAASAGALPVILSQPHLLSRGQSREQQLDAAATALYYSPYMSVPGLLDVYDAYAAATRDHAATVGVPFIDVRAEIPSDRGHFVDSAHFSLRGSRLMGERLAARLLERGEVRAALRDAGCPAS